MNLPSREQVEDWSPAQVASYLSQIKMRECAVTVQRMKMDGRWFLSLSDTDLNKFSFIHRPQLQKIVQDIKKNDDSFLNRLKRFQSEQTAQILKTGRNTLDRMKNKGPPKVPARDYPGDNETEWSGSDFESDVYEDPQFEHDDNYEPPPCERLFKPAPSLSYPVGEYLDKCPARPTHTKPSRAHLLTKPPVPHKPRQPANHEEDYIDPEDDMDEDYIDPSEKDVNEDQLSIPGRSHSPDVYEIPDIDESSASSRCSTKHQLSVQRLPPTPSPRMNVKKMVSCPEPETDDDYEVCNDDESPSSSVSALNEKSVKKSGEDRTSLPAPVPAPLPREPKHPKPHLFQKTTTLTRDHEAAPATKPRDPPNPVSPSSTGFFRVKMSLPREIHQQKSSTPERGSLSQEDRQQEEDAGVYKKSWFASTCDRRTAEDTLIRSAKDGSYLVRKSSGVDVLQPYTLVVFYNGRVYNIPVRFIPNTKQFALGKQKNREERFNSVSDMIENHQKNPLVLVDTQSNTKDSTRLRHPVKL